MQAGRAARAAHQLHDLRGAGDGRGDPGGAGDLRRRRDADAGRLRRRRHQVAQDVLTGGEGEQGRPARGVQGGEGGLVGDAVQDGADAADLAAGRDPGAPPRAQLVRMRGEREQIMRDVCA
ncbi:hypothetical protein [Actinomadura madurae]|uniref:hypothetical protein n=1 Tax=Actinomadura madurae TaxID=1993 RepID=UPI0020D21060|nr:hypothetical protein [Actinomadura madurae]MCP9953824.1 hypothetical protein [Actinomadura madurae]MCP9970574.1 hypothetical protein [Actinomadura madurae]MCP9983049.1 hypothetical protein [Actinomadura madurae]MCQ0005398.1 hypothetical protein [Actinomadura madurae]MCQ0019289.1 hypothetical protein [Actinomadura madurae]